MSRKTTIAAVAAGVGAAAGATLLLRLLWRRIDARTYLRFDTMFGKTRVYQVEADDGRAVRLLEVGGIVQSGTYLGDDDYADLVFEYLKRYDVMFDSTPGETFGSTPAEAPDRVQDNAADSPLDSTPGSAPAGGMQRTHPVRRVCVLGCGGYDYPKHLIAHHPGVIVDAVEIDPAITAIAQRYFFLDRLIEEYEIERTGRLNLVNADALDFLTAEGCAFDAIVNDTFDAGTPPTHLTTRAFARAVHARLAPGGLYLTNIVSALEGPETAFLHEQTTLLEDVFDEVRVIACDPDTLTEADNVIVAARKR